MNQSLIIIFIFFVGGLIALQGSANAALGKFLDHPLHAAILSFATGLIALLIASLFLKSGIPSFSKIFAAPKIILIGGLLGSIFVTSVIFCVPKIGIANVVMAGLCGQIIASMILDYFGAFGMPKHSIDIKRVIGALLVIGGVLLINYQKK